MKITLLGEDRLRLQDAAGPLTIEAESPAMSYSPFHMIASGLGSCIFSVLHSWAEHSDVPADTLAIEVTWTFAENPHRVGRYDVAVAWPELPESRVQAVNRAASLCAVHNTLTHPPSIEVQVRR